MTSVLSYWLSGKAFVLSLYKRDTTRMVGRFFSPLQYTLIYSLNNINFLALPSMHNQLFSLKPTLFPQIYLLIYPPTYTYSACITFIPPHIPTQPTLHLSPHIYLHSLHLPTYTYTACISFIPPHIPTQPTPHLSPHICLHSLHLIYAPTYTYTACISPHIPTQPASN